MGMCCFECLVVERSVHTCTLAQVSLSRHLGAGDKVQLNIDLYFQYVQEQVEYMYVQSVRASRGRVWMKGYVRRRQE